MKPGSPASRADSNVAKVNKVLANYYETDRAVSEYLLFHYGTPELMLPYAIGPHTAVSFPVRCVAECLVRDRVPPAARALDLGCAVGRSAFELSRHCR
jgi:hypothetical protein